jgi:hypothetical protein
MNEADWQRIAEGIGRDNQRLQNENTELRSALHTTGKQRDDWKVRADDRREEGDHLARRLRAELEDSEAAHATASAAADRFRDVLEEVLSLEENPGDDVLVSTIRQRFGKTGDEPRRWRECIAAAETTLGISPAHTSEPRRST